MKKLYKFIIGILICSSILVFSAFIYVYSCITELNIGILTNNNLLSNFNNTTQVYDNSQNLLKQVSAKGSPTITINELSDYTKNAFIAIEDKSFYSHNGLNGKRILKAFSTNLINGKVKEGASTISQQLIKNLYLSNDKTAKRKLQEAYLTIKLEQQYNKDEILQAYLNNIYFGNGTIGIEEASQVYFNCSAKDLTIQQSATLAGIIKSPSYYSSVSNKNSCKNRRNLVLKEMFKNNFITQEEYEKSINSELEIIYNNHLLIQNCYYQQAIIEAQKILNLSEQEIISSNYNIYTYLDSELQQNILENIEFNINKLNKNIDYCIIVLDNNHHRISAIISNKNTLFARSPGSAIKPLLCYAPAFEQGILSPISPIEDSELSFDDWSPRNVDNCYDGWISVRQAITQSKNIPAIRTLEYVGIDKAKSYLNKMDIQFNEKDNHLALALGSMEYGITPLQLTACYSTFANMGNYYNNHIIKRITDKNGKEIYTAKEQYKKVFSEETSYLINDILNETAKSGTASKLKTLPIKLCAKTGTVGTSNNDKNTDAWCISYNPNYTICCWIGNTTGNENNNLNNDINGGTICTKISKNVWECVSKSDDWFEKPNNIIQCNIDSLNWKDKHIMELVSENTPEIYILTDIFNKKYAPTTISNNFINITTPILHLSKNDNIITLNWNKQKQNQYDLYINNKLYAKNCSSPYTLQNKNYSSIYLKAKNKYTEEQKQSNIIKLYNK